MAMNPNALMGGYGTATPGMGSVPTPRPVRPVKKIKPKKVKKTGKKRGKMTPIEKNVSQMQVPPVSGTGM